MRRHLLVLSAFLLSGCDVNGTIKDMGNYMPTIGDRCESTECITPSGKAASDAIKAQREKSQHAGAYQPLKPATATPTATHHPAPPPNDPYDTVEPF